MEDQNAVELRDDCTECVHDREVCTVGDALGVGAIIRSIDAKRPDIDEYRRGKVRSEIHEDEHRRVLEEIYRNEDGGVVYEIDDTAVDEEALEFLFARKKGVIDVECADAR